MFSAENEKIEFVKKFYPKGNVEHWLLEVESIMKKSVKKVILGMNTVELPLLIHPCAYSLIYAVRAILVMSNI